MAKKPKLTPVQMKSHIKNIQEAIEKQKRESKSKHFVAITPELVKKKLQSLIHPHFISQQWTDPFLGGTVDYWVGIYNPDVTPAGDLFAHVWVGSGNVDPTVGTYLLNVDARFPRLGQYVPLIPFGGSAILHFVLKVPSTVERTIYMANTCLMTTGTLFEPGQYVDRVQFLIEVF